MADRITLLDLAKLGGNDAVVGLIEESISEAPELSVIPARTISGTSYKTVLRTGLPSVGFRTLNKGVATKKSKFEEKLVQAYILSGRLEIDAAALKAGDRPGEDLKAIEGAGVMESILRSIGTQVFYGTAADGSGFPGLQAMVDAEHVIDAGGTSANTGSSVYAVRFGSRAVEFVFGKDTSIDLSPWRVETLTDADGNKFPGEVADLCGWVGLQCVSRHVVGRIKDLTEDSGKGMTDALVAKLMSTWKGPAPDVLFMNKRSRYQLQVSRSVTIMTGNGSKVTGSIDNVAPVPTDSNGIKIVCTDQLTSTEALS